MSVPPLATKMWSKDDFDVSTLEGYRKKANITEAYQITCPPDFSKVEVSSIATIPATGSIYLSTSSSGDVTPLTNIRCKTRSFQKLGPIYWIATLKYEGEFGDAGPSAPATATRPIISWTDTETDEPIDEDWDGNPIVTANGEPIDGVTMKIADNVLTVERNYRFFSPSLTSQYRHSVNSDTFATYPAGTGRMVRFSAKQSWDESDNGFWQVSASIQFRYPYNTTSEKAWYARVRHEGYYEKISGRIVRAVDEHGEPVTKPVLLAEDGTRVTDPSNAFWKEFKRYQPLSYNALGLLA